MKVKTTRKAIVNGSTNIRCAGYCDLQALLRNHEPFAYTTGVYGWNFDAYDVYGITICTGYRNMPGKRLEGIEEYEDKARAIQTVKSLPAEYRNLPNDYTEIQVDSFERELFFNTKF